jgi:hypothetical protein
VTDFDDAGGNGCPACGQEYESVSVHQDGLMVNLCKNPRFHRVCFNPVSQDGHAHVEFYHHTHEQVPDAGAVAEDTPV